MVPNDASNTLVSTLFWYVAHPLSVPDAVGFSLGSGMTYDEVVVVTGRVKDVVTAVAG